MPVYEYFCSHCDKVYEYFQKISDDPKTTCEVCGGELKKQISLSSFHLKGSGWYVTDYAKGTGQGTQPVNGNGNSAETASQNDSSGKEEKPKKAESAAKEKSESKPKKESSSGATT